MNAMSSEQFVIVLVVLALWSAVCTVLGHIADGILRRYLLMDDVLYEYADELVAVRNAAVDLMVDVLPEERTSSQVRTVSLESVNALGKAINGLMTFEETHSRVVRDFI